MSDALDQVVAKAVKDSSFRQLLITNPNEALKGFAITDEERTMLEGLNEDNFDKFAGGLGDRETKGSWILGTG